MKILTLSNLYPPHYLGGYELICRALVDGLRRRGHTVPVLTSDHRVTGRDEPQPDLQVERVLKIHGMYGHPWVGIAALRHLEKFNNQALVSALERHRPDLVWVCNMGGISKSLLLTLQRLNIPTVFYLSDHWIARSLTADVWISWWNRHNAPAIHTLARSLLAKTGYRARWQSIAPTNPPRHFIFQRIYFCSRALRELTERAGYPVTHGAVIYCPVRTDLFQGEVHAQAPLRKLLFVGRLTEDKGVMTALKAMRLVRDKFDGELSIYGSGEKAYETELKDFVAREKLPVRFDTVANPAQMPEVYRSHDALLFTSEWEEPFALTPLEAMSCGLPVIGTTTGGSRELFRHGENALTYAAGQAEELATRILELAKQDGLRLKIAREGQKEVRAAYSEETILNHVESYMKETLRIWKPVSLPAFNA